MITCTKVISPGTLKIANGLKSVDIFILRKSTNWKGSDLFWVIQTRVVNLKSSTCVGKVISKYLSSTWWWTNLLDRGTLSQK